MKNKGFTLIELLAVILILGIIALIAIPTVTSVVEQSRRGAADSSAKAYVKAVENKLITMELAGNKLSDGIYTVEELNNLGIELKGTLPSDGVIVIKNQEVESLSIKVNNYAITYSAEDGSYIIGDLIKYEDGTEVYFNPETGKTCDDYIEANSLNENKSGCMRWHIFLDNEYSAVVNMILDHNTTYKIAWTTNDDTSNGPGLNFLNKLKDDTKNWIGVKTRMDYYSFSNPGAEGKVNNFTINYNGYKARILTASEVRQIANLTTFDVQVADERGQYFLENNSFKDPNLTEGQAKYKWLFNYTNSLCSSFGCSIGDSDKTKGYWLAETVATTSDRAWKINYKGAIAPYDGNAFQIQFGIRPVITIEKSLLK